MLTVDAHTHAFAPGQVQARDEIAGRDPTFAELYRDPKARLATMDTLLARMDRDAIDVSVVAGFAFAHERDLAEQNEHLLGASEALGRDRLRPLATINLAHANWREMAEQALSAGACGFGELRPGNQGWDPLGADARALCGLVRDAGAVLLWHVSEPVGHRYPGKAGGITPVELCDLASTEPVTKMVAAHLGGGLSFYLQMPELRQSLASVYFDTAAASLLYDEQSIPRLMDLAGPERVLFASDYPLQSPGRQLERILAVVPGAIAPAVCGQNALALFSRETVTDRNS